MTIIGMALLGMAAKCWWGAVNLLVLEATGAAVERQSSCHANKDYRFERGDVTETPITVEL